jgi:hypothetical protein
MITAHWFGGMKNSHFILTQRYITQNPWMRSRWRPIRCDPVGLVVGKPVSAAPAAAAVIGRDCSFIRSPVAGADEQNSLMFWMSCCPPA